MITGLIGGICWCSWVYFVWMLYIYPPEFLHEKDAPFWLWVLIFAATGFTAPIWMPPLWLWYRGRWLWNKLRGRC